jgi:hypothetical protein
MNDYENNLVPLLPAVYRPLARPAVKEDAHYLGPHLRQADLDELKASTGRQGEEALLCSLEHSAMAWTFLHPQSKKPLAMTGLSWMERCDSVGIPWLLGAEFDRQAARVFLSFFPPVLSYMHKFRPILMNMVDVRHHKAMYWLQRAGFILLGPFIWGVEQRDFYQLISCKGVNNVRH